MCPLGPRRCRGVRRPLDAGSAASRSLACTSPKTRTRYGPSGTGRWPSSARDSRLPRDLWRFRVALEQVADLSQPAALRALGLPEMLPDRSQWAAFQDAGARLAQKGFRAVLFRSSARPAGLCLCAFGTEEGFAGVTPIGPPERVPAAPAPPRGMRT